MVLIPQPRGPPDTPCHAGVSLGCPLDEGSPGTPHMGRGRVHTMVSGCTEGQKCPLLMQEFTLPIKYTRVDIFSNPINTPRQTF